MPLRIGEGLFEAYQEGRIKNSSQAILYIDHVCSKCGHVYAYSNWASNGRMCIRCGNIDKE